MRIGRLCGPDADYRLVYAVGLDENDMNKPQVRHLKIYHGRLSLNCRLEFRRCGGKVSYSLLSNSEEAKFDWLYTGNPCNSHLVRLPKNSKQDLN